MLAPEEKDQTFAHPTEEAMPRSLERTISTPRPTQFLNSPDSLTWVSDLRGETGPDTSESEGENEDSEEDEEDDSDGDDGRWRFS